MLRRFETILTVIFSFSLIFGTFPMKKHSRMTYKFSWKLYCYCILVGMIACIEGTYWMLDEFYYYMHSLTIIIDSIGFWFNIYTWVSNLILSYLRKENLSDIISRLYTIHCHIGITSYRLRYAASIFVLSVLNAIPSILYIVRDAIYFSDGLLVSIYFLFINVTVITACQYSVMMGLLTDQVVFLTRQLCLPMFSFDVRKLVEKHHAICVLAARINKGFNIFLLQATAITFIVIVINIYIVIVCILKPEEFEGDTKMLTALLEASVNVGILVLIVSAAQGAEESAVDFNIQLRNNMLSSKALGKDNNLKTYVDMKYGIQQTACGFFKLDYSLLTSMTAATLTYVVLLVQFTLVK